MSSFVDSLVPHSSSIFKVFAVTLWWFPWTSNKHALTNGLTSALQTPCDWMKLHQADVRQQHGKIKDEGIPADGSLNMFIHIEYFLRSLSYPIVSWAITKTGERLRMSLKERWREERQTQRREDADTQRQRARGISKTGTETVRVCVQGKANNGRKCVNLMRERRSRNAGYWC